MQAMEEFFGILFSSLATQRGPRQNHRIVLRQTDGLLHRQSRIRNRLNDWIWVEHELYINKTRPKDNFLVRRLAQLNQRTAFKLYHMNTDQIPSLKMKNALKIPVLPMYIGALLCPIGGHMFPIPSILNSRLFCPVSGSTANQTSCLRPTERNQRAI